MTELPYDPPNNSPLQRSNGRLVTEVVLTGLSMANALVEVVAARNYSVANTQPLSTKRRVLAGVALVACTVKLGQLANDAQERLTWSQPDLTRGASLCTNEQLQSNLIGGLVSLALVARPLISGKTFWRKQPLSRVGRAEGFISLAANLYVVRENAVELYRRSPELRQRVTVARVMGSLMARRIVAKMMHREAPEMSQNDMFRLLGLSVDDGTIRPELFTP